MTFKEYEHLKGLIDQMNELQLKMLNDFIIGVSGTMNIYEEHQKDLDNGVENGLTLIEQLRFTPVNYLQYLCMSYEERKECNDFFLDFEHDPIHFQWYQHTFEHFIEWVNTKHRND